MIDLDELERLERAATKDWTYTPIEQCLDEYMSGGQLRDGDTEERWMNGDRLSDQGIFAEFNGYHEGSDGFERRVNECNANGALCVAARNVLPSLLEEIRRLRAAMLPTGNNQEMSVTGNIATAKAEGAREERTRVSARLEFLLTQITDESHAPMSATDRANMQLLASLIGWVTRADHDRSDGDG